MCYSAQVVASLRKFVRQLPLQLDYEQAEHLFKRRLEDPSIKIARAFDEAGRRRAARENIATADGRVLNFFASHAEWSSPLYKPSPYTKGDDY